MLQLQSLSLKILYKLTGFPLVLAIILTPDSLEKHPLHNFWWTLIGIILVIRVLLEKEKYDTGAIHPSWKTTLLAIMSVAALGIFVYFKVV